VGVELLNEGEITRSGGDVSSNVDRWGMPEMSSARYWDANERTEADEKVSLNRLVFVEPLIAY